MALFYARMGGYLPGGDAWLSGCHFSGSGTVDAAMIAWELSVEALWAGNAPLTGIAPFYSNQISASSLVVYELDPVTRKSIDKVEQAGTSAGTGTGSCLPTEVAVVVSLRTKQPGPSGRGRMYLPNPMVTACNITGRLDSTFRTAVVDNAAAMLQLMDTSGYNPILSSDGHPDRTITSIDVGDVFDAQRRRRNKIVESRASASAQIARNRAPAR